MATTGDGRVRIVFEGDNTDLERAVRSSQAALGRLDSTTSKHSTTTRKASDETSRFSKTTSTLGSSLKFAAVSASAALAAYVSISQATTAISTTEDLAKATKSLHENLGLSIKSASQWAAVAQVRGVDSTKLGMAFKTLATQVTAARDGSASAATSFHRLGLSQKEINRGSKDTNFLVGEVADGLGKLSGGADKAAISGRLFGRGWQTIQPILRDGSKAMQDQLDLANKYGASFGGKALDSFTDLIAAQRELKFAQLGLQVQFTEHIAPALIDAGLALAQFINRTRRGKGAGNDIVNIFKAIGDVVSFTVEYCTTLFHILRDGFNGVVKAAKWAGNAIGDVFRTLTSPVRFAARIIGRVMGGLGRGIGKVAKGISGAIRAVGSVVRDIVHFIVNAVNRAIRALGDLKDALPDINLPDLPGSSGGDIPGGNFFGDILNFNRGGTVPGQGEGDKIPAMLEPKEFVVNKKATERHRPLLEAINRGTPRFGASTEAFVLPLAVGRQGGGLAQLRQSERRAQSRLHHLQRLDSPSKHQTSHMESLATLISQLRDAISESNRNMHELRRVRRDQRSTLDEVVAASVSGFLGSRVGLASQAAGVPGSFGAY